jgi:hypothetical protein
VGRQACYSSLEMRSLRAEFLALLAALMLLAGTAFAGPQYFCRMSGRVLADCCCASNQEQQESVGESTVVSGDCCERLAPRDRSQVTRSATGENVPPAALSVMLAEPVYAFPALAFASTIVEQSRGPPIVGPPIFVVKCAFLI